MIEKFSMILVGVLISGGLFLSGYLVNQKIVSTDTKALIRDTLSENSLVERFAKPSPSVLGISSLNVSNSHVVAGRRAQEILVYHLEDGKIETILLSNGSRTLVDTIEPRAENIEWSNDRQKLLAHFKNHTIFYDLTSKISKQYDTSIIGPTLNHLGDRIAYITFDKITASGAVYVSDPMLTSAKIILPTRTHNWNLEWIDETHVSLSNRQSYNNLSVFTINIQNPVLTNIIDRTYVSDILWSPHGKTLLYTLYDKESKSTLSVIRDGMTTQLSSIYTTQDCRWSIDSRHIYCANQKEGFVKIDSQKEEPAIKYDETVPAGIQNMFLSPTEDDLFVVHNGTLRSIPVNAKR